MKTVTLSLEDESLEAVLEAKNKFLLDKIFDLALSRICKERRFSGQISTVIKPLRRALMDIEKIY